MKNHNDRKSRLFFIEFLIVLFFFLLISTVCIRIFAAAGLMTRRADALSHAQTLAASAAEALEASDGSMESAGILLKEFFSAQQHDSENAASVDESISVAETEISIAFDKNFDLCPRTEADYTLTVSPDGVHARINHARICVTDRSQEILYSLSVSWYVPLTRGEVLS